ncbi:hypothetical protein CANARDRAFT_7902 [[Candida] arabinofermentans NRRL YB-2248]|uniref:FAD dependent oxidoreductase domain-containing protein n=1 Tax=[Candida] arabinofermentans NRRL YB-2248 TaxID=983967 RepID=A0A1E4T0J4_9ASCO|nr:hypothetical protein CANARDRAFT_7902 [[Candida] arabinofermentans NRRL YB-2248]
MKNEKLDNKIVVVGAGVIGLTCAYQLLLKGYTNVTVIAKDFPSTGLLKPEYTSSKSGAHFRPFPSKSRQELRDSKLARSTYRAFKKLATESPESSIKWVEGIDYLEKRDPLYVNLIPGYTEEIDKFQVIPSDRLPPNIQFGAKYSTWCMNSPRYLEFLETKLKMKFGVKFVQKSVRSLKQVSRQFPNYLIINCTGMGLQFDGSWDKDCFPIRGQTLLVRPPLDCPYENQTITYQLADGAWIFVIPRPLDGGIILGGTKQVGSTDKRANKKDTDNIIELGKKRFPRLLIDGEFDIKRVNVGFRPARKGGVKISKQVVEGVTIVDCYGFAGSGMEMSWGAAEHVVQLVAEEKPRL